MYNRSGISLVNRVRDLVNRFRSNPSSRLNVWIITGQIVVGNCNDDHKAGTDCLNTEQILSNY